MILRSRLLLLTLASLAAIATRATAGDMPGYSDIAKIAPNAFVVVNDRKRTAADDYRLGVVTMTKHEGAHFQPVTIADWPRGFDPPSDLEACCVLPGEPLTILAAESGAWDHINARIFHLYLARNADGLWEAAFLRSFALLPTVGPWARPLDPAGRSYEGNQVEGLAVIATGDTLFLLYAERGGEIADGKHGNGTLVWGTLDLTRYVFTPCGGAPLVTASVLGNRDCSALHVFADASRANFYRVISVATMDPPGSDVGPFTSVVFEAGTLAVAPGKADFVYTPAPDATAQHRLIVAGIKVEGLTAAPDNVPGSTFMLATDDEDFGGVVRPVVWPAIGD